MRPRWALWCWATAGRNNELKALPESYSALLQHVQEQILQASTEKVTSRLARLLHCLSPRITPGKDGDSPTQTQVRGIDLNVVRSLCADGVSDEVPVLRASFWKLVLGYLPADVFLWDEVLAESRQSYARFVRELLEVLDAEGISAGRDARDTSGDQPENEATSETGLGKEVSPKPTSLSREGMVGLDQVLDQINKDVFRTRPEMDFFARRIDGQHALGPGQNLDATDLIKPCYHYDVLARILLVYARLNPGVQYVQGMNELCAPLYYLFCQDGLNRTEAEADVFFCFSLLMSDMRDAFVKTLDHEENGMIGRVQRFSDLLREKDQQVWRHLEEQQVRPLFYAVRWLMLMLTQEFEMPDTLRVWDSLLSDLARPHPLLFYVCVAMVMLVREALLAGDFTECLRLLQRYPPMPVDDTLQFASQLRAADLKSGGQSITAALQQDGAWQRGRAAMSKGGARAAAAILGTAPEPAQQQAQQGGPGAWFARLVRGSDPAASTSARGPSDSIARNQPPLRAAQGGSRPGGDQSSACGERPWISSFGAVVSEWLEASTVPAPVMPVVHPPPDVDSAGRR